MSRPPASHDSVSDPSAEPNAEDLEPDGRPGMPRGVLGRFLLFVALVAAGFLAFRFTPLGDLLEHALDRDRLMAMRATLQAQWWAAPLLVGLYVVLAPLGAPVSPLMFAGGAVFGTLIGSGLNFLGTFLGAAASFYLARALGGDFVEHLLGDRLRRVERLVERKGFWTLARIRLIPIPFPLVNYGAALAGVPAGTFLGATAIGLLPANLVFTYFAANLVASVAGDRAGIFLRLGLAIAALLLLSFLPALVIGMRRRRRLRELAARRQRLGR